MARLIDADALKEKFPAPYNWSDPDGAYVHKTYVWTMIGLAPTIEPEFEPLPCRKCRFYTGTYCLHPDTYGRFTHAYDFCAWAEAESEGGDDYE